MASVDKLQELADLLKQADATAHVSPDRVVRSTLYDLDYHVALVACAFATNGQKRTDNTVSILTHWLKLLQFVAVRPSLLPGFKGWAKARRHPDLDTWQKMPRGFLGDRTHDRTIELLIAGTILYRTADTLFSGARFNVLTSLYKGVVVNGLLAREREVLQEMATTPVNRTLLRGE